MMKAGQNRHAQENPRAHRCPQLSVVIPTLNRADRLERLLGDLTQQRATGIFYELLVVDNGSSDGTRAIVDAARRSDPRIHYLHEPTAGASRARNLGIRHARAAIVAFVDDDVRAAPDWVRSIVDAFADHPEIDCLGGRIEPHWPAPPPPWLDGRHWGPLALQIGRGHAAYLDREHASACLVSANFACRAATLREVGGFSTEYLRDEDRELNLRLWRAGKRGMYVDHVIVHAEIQPERLRKAYHRTWHAVTGRSHSRMRYREVIDRDGRLHDRSTTGGRYLFGAPGFLYREAVRHLLRWVGLAVLGRFDEAFFDECRFRYALAYLSTRWRASVGGLPARWFRRARFRTPSSDVSSGVAA